MDSKLRAIYESLDIGANKQALKLCNALLLKKKESQIVKALKAVALVRSGATHEALEICTGLQKSKPPPTDETVLNTMQLVYKSAEKYDEMITCYENAWAAEPKNEALASGLFFCCVKSANCAKQQQVALKMFKQFTSKDAYYYWAVFSIVTQAKQAGEPRLFQLAEKMMEKMKAENKIKSSEVLQLYLTIFTSQNKYEQAHTLLASPLGQLYNVPGERILLLADLLFKQGKFSAALALYAERMAASPDEWNAHVGHIDCVLQLLADSPAVLLEAKARIEVLKAQDSLVLVRAPYLAEIELQSRLLKGNTPKEEVDAFSQLLVAYFERFGAKPTCVYDLRPYLSYLLPESFAEFCQKLSTSVERPPSNVASVQRLVALLQLQRLLGFHSTTERSSLFTGATGLIQDFKLSLTLQRKTESSERLAGDDLILLAAHTLQDLYQLNMANNQIYLFEAIAVLEYGHSQSKQNFQFLLQLVELYCRVGAFKLAYGLYPQLSIRYIQLDTLSHLVLDDGIRLGFYQLMGSFFDQILKFYADNANITPDFIAQAFINNSYSKIEEISMLKTKLEQSHQLAIVKTEQVLATLHQSDLHVNTLNSILAHPAEVDELKIEGLFSNQDLVVFDRWDSITDVAVRRLERPFASTSARLIGRDRATQLTWLRIRRIILNLLHKVVNGQDDIILRSQLKAASKSLNLHDKDVGKAESFDELYMAASERLFDANASFLQQENLLEDTQSTDVAIFKVSVADFLAAMNSLLKFVEVVVKDSVAGISIPILYMFAGEIFCWVVIVVQQWIGLPKTKKKRTADAKLVIEQAVTELKTISEALRAVMLSSEFSVPEAATSGLLGTTNNADTRLHSILENVIADVHKSHQQSKTNILAMLSTRIKAIANWPS